VKSGNLGALGSSPASEAREGEWIYLRYQTRNSLFLPKVEPLA
jgi:hypothetical protein